MPKNWRSPLKSDLLTPALLVRAPISETLSMFNMSIHKKHCNCTYMA